MEYRSGIQEVKQLAGDDQAAISPGTDPARRPLRASAPTPHSIWNAGVNRLAGRVKVVFYWSPVSPPTFGISAETFFILLFFNLCYLGDQPILSHIN